MVATEAPEKSLPFKVSFQILILKAVYLPLSNTYVRTDIILLVTHGKTKDSQVCHRGIPPEQGIVK